MNLTSSRVQLVGTLVATVAIAAVAESALRVASVHYDSTFYVGDSQLGWALRPRLEGYLVSEGQQFIRINSDGMRAREFSPHKAAGTLRIAVLGNSWTEALQVPMEKNFCSVIEHRLSGSPCVSGRKVEVLNFGVSGYATAQELVQLRSRVWKYEPDVVLLAFYTLRDVLNNVRQFNNAADPAQSPYFRFAGNRLVLDDSFRKLPQVSRGSSLTSRLRTDVGDNIRLYQTTNHFVRLLRIEAAKATMAAEAPANSSKGNLEDLIYAPPASPEIAGAWEVTEGILRMMKEEVAAHDASFLVVSLANRAQTHPDIRVRRANMARLGVLNLDYADDRLRAFGAAEGIPVTTLAHRLGDFGEKNKTYLNGFANTAMGQGHWNETGHQVAGEAMADDVCSLVAAQGAAAATTAHR